MEAQSDNQSGFGIDIGFESFGSSMPERILEAEYYYDMGAAVYVTKLFSWTESTNLRTGIGYAYSRAFTDGSFRTVDSEYEFGASQFDEFNIRINSNRLSLPVLLYVDFSRSKDNRSQSFLGVGFVGQYSFSTTKNSMFEQSELTEDVPGLNAFYLDSELFYSLQNNNESCSRHWSFDIGGRMTILHRVENYNPISAFIRFSYSLF